MKNKRTMGISFTAEQYKLLVDLSSATDMPVAWIIRHLVSSPLLYSIKEQMKYPARDIDFLQNTLDLLVGLDKVS